MQDTTFTLWALSKCLLTNWQQFLVYLPENWVGEGVK